VDKASKIAQEAVHFVMEQSRLSNPPAPVGPMDYEASFAMKLRECFPETKKDAKAPNMRPLAQPLYEVKPHDHDLGDHVKMVGAPDIEAVVTAILVRKGNHVNYELTWIHEGEVKTGWLTTDSIMAKDKKSQIGFMASEKK
jgi:hypothetical protein